MVQQKRKQTKKKKRSKLAWFILILLVICAAAILNSNEAKREIVKAYNKYSVYLEKIHISKSPYSKQFDVEIPKGYHVHGIDVSRYQRKIDWQEVSKTRSDTLKIDFVFVKATEGKTLSDRYYAYNMEEARKNNIICGAYHYYKPHVNSTEQANNYINLVELKCGDLPPVLDIEEESPYGNDNMRKGIKNWLQIIEQHYGMKPIIYTSYSFHKDYLSGDEFKEYPFWIAHYYKKQIKTKGRWIFWQHNDKARVNGISGCVDINVYNGNLESLKGLCKRE